MRNLIKTDHVTEPGFSFLRVHFNRAVALDAVVAYTQTVHGVERKSESHQQNTSVQRLDRPANESILS